MNKITRVQRKKRRRRTFLRIILFFCFLILIITLALKTKFFLIDSIKVIGNNKISNKTIIDISNIEKNYNIFKIKTKDSEENIEKLPYVKEVNIKKKLPKTIVINIVERKEVLQIKDLSSHIIIDEEGYVLKVVDDKENKLPELIGINLKNISPGNNLFLDLEEFNPDFILEAQNLNLLYQMEKIQILDNNDINILLLNSMDVAFGSLDNVKYKLNLLKEVLKDIDKKQLDVKMILMDRGENPVIVLEDEEG